MLSLANSEGLPLVPEEPALFTSDAFSVFLRLIAIFAFYRHILCLFGWKLNIFRGARRFIEMKKRHYTFSRFCPKRRARFHKCAKRCEAKRGGYHECKDPCAIMVCASKLARLHMPAPLPWRKKKACKQQQSQSKKLQDKAVLKEAAHKRDVPTKEDKTSISPEEPATTTRQTSPVPFFGFQQPAQEPVTPLIDLARMQYWELVVQQATRKQAKYRDSDGLYPLHWAVSGGPPTKVVESLLKAYPSAARKLDKEGSSALHFATHYSASSGVLEALLAAYPKAIRVQDRYGRTPIYHAVDKCASMDSLKLLVQADPSMVTMPCLPKEHRDLPLSRTTATMTPLYIAWAGVVRDCRALSSKHKKGKKCKPLEKAMLLLEAAFFHQKNLSPSVPKDYCFISSAIAMDLYLPDQVVSIAIQKFPKDLSHADEDGRVALAQAAATNQYSPERADTLISLLLAAYSEAATLLDRQGRSPLQLALLAGKTWQAGVSRLFQANPEAIRWTDQEGLPPFAVAALADAIRAAEVSSGLVGEAPKQTVLRADPYNLLSSKQRNLLERARQRLERGSKEEQQDKTDACAGTEAERLTTILDLLRLEPSSLTSSSR